MGVKTSAVLVAHHNILKASGGGVQVCHREYAAVLEAAGFELRPIPYEFSRGIASRILYRIFPKVVSTTEPPELLQNIMSAVSEIKAEFIFFAWSVFPGLSLKLAKALPKVRQVLLSHGVEGLDFCLDQRLRRASRTENRFRIVAERMLGQQLLYEAEQRRCLDAVLSVSPFEVEIEKWLGSRRSLWVPRTIIEPQLVTQPIDQRVGCVSTLNHTPNIDGLVKLFDAFAGNVSRDFRFRLVGQPVEQGAALAERYSFVEYLGALSDSQLRAAAATWCCFVNPIFVYAKGYSTKLATALGWGLPIATTEYGARGYLWDRERIPLAESAVELVRLVTERCTVHRFEEHQQAIKHIVAMTPKIEQVGAQIRQFLRP